MEHYQLTNYVLKCCYHYFCEPPIKSVRKNLQLPTLKVQQQYLIFNITFQHIFPIISTLENPRCEFPPTRETARKYALTDPECFHHSELSRTFTRNACSSALKHAASREKIPSAHQLFTYCTSTHAYTCISSSQIHIMEEINYARLTENYCT